ncbi:hypothetical protein TKK_0002328 [Trichogramma kaykai]
MADDNQNCSSTLKSMHEEVAYQKIEEKNHEFLRKLYPFIRDYQGHLPNLKDIFQPGAIDWLLTESSYFGVVKHLCEKLSRRFFRRYALDSFLDLTRYQLPILCCEMILDESLINKDLYHICLAAAGQII